MARCKRSGRLLSGIPNQVGFIGCSRVRYPPTTHTDTHLHTHHPHTHTTYHTDLQLLTPTRRHLKALPWTPHNICNEANAILPAQVKWQHMQDTGGGAVVPETVATYANIAYVIFKARRPVLDAFDVHTNETVWTYKETTEQSFGQTGVLSLHLVEVHELLVAVMSPQAVSAFHCTTGELLWTFEITPDMLTETNTNNSKNSSANLLQIISQLVIVPSHSNGWGALCALLAVTFDDDLYLLLLPISPQAPQRTTVWTSGTIPESRLLSVNGDNNNKHLKIQEQPGVQRDRNYRKIPLLPLLILLFHLRKLNLLHLRVSTNGRYAVVVLQIVTQSHCNQKRSNHFLNSNYLQLLIFHIQLLTLTNWHACGTSVMKIFLLHGSSSSPQDQNFVKILQKSPKEKEKEADTDDDATITNLYGETYAVLKLLMGVCICGCLLAVMILLSLV